jgi:ubiquinone/menaquinone biosynthesis C-methylase UbiE
MRRLNRNQKLVHDYQAIYDHVHTAYPNYGCSPTRPCEFTLVNHDLRYSSVLDVGCGQGQLLKWIRLSRPQVQLSGIDISQVALDKIKLANVTLKQGKAQEIPFPDDQFDLVICTDVLEHLPEDDVRQAIKELKRVGAAHVWIQTEDCNCSEDKYLAGTKYAGITLHETRRTIYWWEKNIQNQQMRIVMKRHFGSKMSFLCSVNPSILES